MLPPRLATTTIRWALDKDSEPQFLVSTVMPSRVATVVRMK